MENNLFFPGEGRKRRILGETTTELSIGGDRIIPVVDTKLGETYHIKASALGGLGIDPSIVNENDALLANADGTFVPVALETIINQATLATQGYFSLLSSFYFTPGVATETTIDVADENIWVDVNFVVYDGGSDEGLFDKRPTAMKEANGIAFDEATGFFTLEGLDTNSFCFFRASMTFEPEEDEGELQARLFFERHSNTTPADPFPIEDVVATMSQGADIEYPVEPFLSFFVGDTIDTNAPGDSGKCKFQIKSSVAGIVRMRALTWYINK